VRGIKVNNAGVYEVTHQVAGLVVEEEKKEKRKSSA